MIVLVISFVGFMWALWMLLDANRLSRHVAKAEEMMAGGVPECEAMERSGCNYWDVPWYRRLFIQYPKL